jgi:hypothetical protein
MAITTTTLHDDANGTLFQDVDDVAHCTTIRYVPKAGSVEANRQDLLAKASAAINNNITFLNLASPTNAQTLTQVKALTRQVNALIKLAVLDDVSDTTGT